MEVAGGNQDGSRNFFNKISPSFANALKCFAPLLLWHGKKPVMRFPIKVEKEYRKDQNKVKRDFYYQPILHIQAFI